MYVLLKTFSGYDGDGVAQVLGLFDNPGKVLAAMEALANEWIAGDGAWYAWERVGASHLKDLYEYGVTESFQQGYVLDQDFMYKESIPSSRFITPTVKYEQYLFELYEDDRLEERTRVRSWVTFLIIWDSSFRKDFNSVFAYSDR